MRPEFVYAQARLQARHAQRPSEALWRSLEASRTHRHYLALARSGPLAAWTETIDDGDDPHRVERSLRRHWRGYVDEVARWMPARWQGAIRWFGVLPELPLIDALRRRDPAERWLTPDEPLIALIHPDPAARVAALERDDRAAFATPTGADRPAMAVWLDEWQRRLPSERWSPALLGRPAELLLPRLRRGSATRAAAEPATHHALQRLFRRWATSPVAAFAHLALVALDVERLRGGIVARSVFGTADAGGA